MNDFELRIECLRLAALLSPDAGINHKLVVAEKVYQFVRYHKVADQSEPAAAA